MKIHQAISVSFKHLIYIGKIYRLIYLPEKLKRATMFNSFMEFQYSVIAHRSYQFIGII